MRLTRETLAGRHVIRQRRLFPFGYFSPAFEPSLGLWFKADSLLGTLNDNDPVSSWPDSSPSNLPYGQATGSAQPTFKENIVNGLPVIRFATNDVLTPNPTAYTYGENNTVIAVVSESTSGGGYIFAGSGSEGGPAFISGFSSKDFEYFSRVTAERATFAASAAAGFHALALVREDGGAFGESFNGFYDGLHAFNQTVNGTDNWSGRTLTKIGDFSAGDFFNGDIAELIFCRRLLGPARLNDFLAGYIWPKYGILQSVI